MPTSFAHHSHQDTVLIRNVTSEHYCRRTLAAMPKSICQTSPRLAFGMGCFALIQDSRSFGGDGHHLVVAQPVTHLHLQPLSQFPFLARRQLAESFLDLHHRAHWGNTNLNDDCKQDGGLWIFSGEFQ